MRSAALLAAGLVVLTVGVVGCGSDDDGDEDSGNGGSGNTQELFSPQFVTDSDIAAQKDGSPSKALLEWWQSYQFADAPQVIARTNPATVDKLGKKDLTELVKARGQGLQGVEVLGESDSGDTASVRVGLLTFAPEEPGDPPPTEPTASKPATFTMKERGGEWLFAESAYLSPQIENLKRSQRQSEEKGG